MKSLGDFAICCGLIDILEVIPCLLKLGMDKVANELVRFSSLLFFLVAPKSWDSKHDLFKELFVFLNPLQGRFLAQLYPLTLH
jgi:hypothetical protein